MSNGTKKRAAKEDTVTVRLAPATKKKLKAVAKKRDREVSYIVRQFIDEGLSRA